MKGTLQYRSPHGWVDLMPFIGKNVYLAVSDASRKLGVSVRVKPEIESEDDFDDKDIS